MGRRQFGSVRRLPSGRWQVRYHNGLGERVVAPDTFATKADAQRWLAVAQADLLRGTFIDPSAGGFPSPNGPRTGWSAGRASVQPPWRGIERLCAPTSSLRSVFSP
jgi:hypothetical protein